MADALLTYFRATLPTDIAHLADPYLTRLVQGDYQSLLEGPEAKQLFEHSTPSYEKQASSDDFPNWSDAIFHRLGILLADRSKAENQAIYFCIGYAALLAFLQSNVTGPPLPFSSAKLLFPSSVTDNAQGVQRIRQSLIASLVVDGVAAYKLTPNVELLCLADTIMTCPPVLKNIKVARWAKLRVAFVHQRLLSEVSPTLQNVIYDDLDLLAGEMLGGDESQTGSSVQVEFILERATIHLHHGLEKLARQDVDDATKRRRFEYALTGRLGKRTKFQEKDISQLVVLARSAESSTSQEAGHASDQSVKLNGKDGATQIMQPTKLDLNDDTLLEAISFTESKTEGEEQVTDSTLSSALLRLDPASQPQLDPLDSIILLTVASSITNTSPQHGLTREETLPYATRVLDGGSSNWQIYTQALLVRSRIEGYRSRTIERGLLQLQALVDQVIADTAGSDADATHSQAGVEANTSFLPRPKDTESAPNHVRLRYIFQLASPTRWDLEAELAARWVQLGGLRSALEIYERLQMWPEAALCWAATEREDKARRIVRKQLYHATNSGPDVPEEGLGDNEEWQGIERSPPPLDAPRLYCILGDLDSSAEMYERAWSISGQRYARAQRSLGRLYLTRHDYVKSAEAYSKSLQVDQLNHGSWFALGCCLLELAQYEKAVEAFSRCVQLDDSDAEAWSNFAAALLRLESDDDESSSRRLRQVEPDDAEYTNDQSASSDKKANRLDALKALKRAASLKHDSYRIWDNVLTVAASVDPPDYPSVLSAQKRIIDLRGATDGEKCIDVKILEMLAQHVIASSDHYDPSQPGIGRLFVKLMDESVVPLITGSAELWRLVAKVALWRNKAASALDTEEKAWRVVTGRPGWQSEDERKWNDVVEATIRLCNAYENLGPRERTEGLGAGEIVLKDWKFKARSAVRGVLGKGKATWEGTEGWARLQDLMEQLRG